MTRLNLGSGERNLTGYLSVDCNADLRGIDLVHDLNKPLPYPDKSIEKIFASHIIEHFWWEDVFEIMRDWYRVLQPNGVLEVWTVNFQEVVNIFGSGLDEVSKIHEMNRLIYNHRVYGGSEHQAIFTRDYLFELMRRAGFKRVEAVSIDEFPFQGVHCGFNMGVRGYK